MSKKVIFIFVLVLAVNLIFAGGIALSGVGTRAKAMGGAMRGLADDASAMYWNPAGLSFVEETTLTVGIHYVDFNGEWETADSTKYENADVLNLIPSLVYAKNCVDKPWNVGFGVYIPFGLSAEWDLYDMPVTNPVTGDPLVWVGDIQENEKAGSLMVIDFHPTFSYKIDEYLSVGLGISMDYASMAINKLDLHPSFGAYLPTYTQLEGSGTGYGYNYGVMLKPCDKVSLGFSGRSEVVLDLEGDAQINMYVNDYVAPFIGLPGAADKSYNPDVEAKLVLPADWGFGMGYKIKENWLLAADFTYTGWESVDVITLNFEEGFYILDNPDLPIADTEMVLNWKNTIRYSIGTEYLMDKWAFRAGYYFDESPLIDETMTVTFPDFSDKNAFNFGVGYWINDNLGIDFGFEYIMMEEREITDPTPENWLGTYNGNIMDIMIDLTWKF
ncbi:MAG: outer membrane protein transport protein [Candidatus Cloacimonetes bacterium]|nr:outer membrane protein transport protein [Candidatus Cloacimonadota bacterium]